MTHGKTKVFSMYDTANQTWNIMDMDKQCLFFGTIDGLEEWLDNNKNNYQEELHQRLKHLFIFREEIIAASELKLLI